MSESELINFHFIELKGSVTGPSEQPAAVSEHRSLSINKGSILKLIASRDSPNVGDPVPGLTPSPIDTQDEPPALPSRLSSTALDITYNLPVLSVGAADESQAAEAAEREPQPQPEAAPEAAPAVEIEEEVVERDTIDEPESTPEAIVPEAPSGQIEAESHAEAPIAEVVADVEEAASSYLETHDLIKLGAPPLETQAEPSHDASDPGRVAAESPPAPMPELALETTGSSDTDSVLVDVQATLNSLADMAKGLTQQKLEAVKQQESLDQRKSHLYEKERLLAEKDEQLRALEARLNHEASTIERTAEDNARALAERSVALKTLAENVEARDRSTAKLAESLRLEKQRYEALAEQLQKRADTLDEREATLNRKEEDLAEKLKQLISAKDRFRSIVKTFNETVQFNNTLNAISSTVLDETSL